jgi:hypothetical protein
MLYDGFLEKVNTAFTNALAEIEAQHNFEYGPEFEIAICRTLRRVLPQKFGICRGFVVNRAGDAEGDDIIIYERLRYPPARFLPEDDFSQKHRIPIEAAFAYIEAKHTLEIEGNSDSSLSHAVKQAARVKALCDQREPVPLSEIAPHVRLEGPFFVQDDRPGWPTRRNPFYSAVISRQVRRAAREPLLSNPEHIAQVLHGPGKIPGESIFPDLIIVGQSVVLLPITIKAGIGEIESPFVKATRSPDYSILSATGLAFGAGLVQLWWALDHIELGSMPWDDVLAAGLGIQNVATNRQGS